MSDEKSMTEMPEGTRVIYVDGPVFYNRGKKGKIVTNRMRGGWIEVMFDGDNIITKCSPMFLAVAP